MLFGKKSSDNGNIRPENLNKIFIIVTIVVGIALGFTFILMIGTNKNLLNLQPPKQATIFYDGAGVRSLPAFLSKTVLICRYKKSQ